MTFTQLTDIPQRSERPLVSAEESIQYCTPELLALICSVVQDTDTPSWYNSVPYNFGDADAGKLKADEWRSFATLYLPLALVKVWGPDSEHKSQTARKAKQDALDHTMLLVSAIILACYRRTSRERAAAYRDCITTYLSRFQTTYPSSHQKTFTPNSHGSVHIYDFLLLFGAVHSWWTFPFERLVGVLQRLKSNHKRGALMRLFVLVAYLSLA